LFLPTTATATIKSAAKKKGNGERERERERKRKRENKRDDGEEGKTRTNKKRAKKLEQNRTCDLWETKDTLFGQSAETFFHACPELLDTVINK
jgi:hypothetical protein